MRRLAYVGLAAAAALAAGCDGLKEAMTAHADVVARAGSRELSVDRLAKILGSNANIPLDPQNAPQIARIVANLWVNYQLMGVAAARNDSLRDQKVVDKALWLSISQSQVRRLHDSISKGRKMPDTTAITESQYMQGDWLAASHILFMIPDTATPQKVDSVRKKAEAVRVQATAANFSSLADKHTEDPSGKGRGGSLGVFPKGYMVPDFEKGVVALKPGEISPLVRTQFGFHIIRRLPYTDVRGEYGQVIMSAAAKVADSTYLVDLEKAGKINVKAKAPAMLKAISADMDAHRKDNSVLATSAAGNLTAARVGQRLRAMGQQAQQLAQQIAQTPDSSLSNFVKSLVVQDLVLHEADRMKIQADTSDTNAIRQSFYDMVVGTWRQLGLDPKALTDSGKTSGDREKIGAAHVEQYVDALVSGQAQYVQIPDELETVLRDRYNGKVVDAGLTRAVERAIRIRADSTGAAKQAPASDVPMPPPGAANAPPPQTPPQAPPPKPPPPKTPPPSTAPGTPPPAGTKPPPAAR